MAIKCHLVYFFQKYSILHEVRNQNYSFLHTNVSEIGKSQRKWEAVFNPIRQDCYICTGVIVWILSTSEVNLEDMGKTRRHRSTTKHNAAQTVRITFGHTAWDYVCRLAKQLARFNWIFFLLRQCASFNCEMMATRLKRKHREYDVWYLITYWQNWKINL